MKSFKDTMIVKQMTYRKHVSVLKDRALKTKGELFPHPVGVFCMHLEPPQFHIMQKIYLGESSQH